MTMRDNIPRPVPHRTQERGLLFLLYVSGIGNCAPSWCVYKTSCWWHQFFLHIKSLEDTINKASNTLSHFSTWFCANKSSLSNNKSLYSIFGKHANDVINTTIHLCNNDIQEVNCCKYLGVYVDNTLLWKKIILNIYIKVIKVCWYILQITI